MAESKIIGTANWQMRPTQYNLPQGVPL